MFENLGRRRALPQLGELRSEVPDFVLQYNLTIYRMPNIATE